jgi:DNA-binding SARP family transcriptional activator/TPR repeat protein
MQRGLESRDHLFVGVAQDREPGASEAFSSVVALSWRFLWKSARVLRVVIARSSRFVCLIMTCISDEFFATPMGYFPLSKRTWATRGINNIKGWPIVLHILSSGQVQLCFLGPVEIRRGDRQLDLGPKRVALLAFLALEGRSRRKTLAQLLWPGSDDPLNNLAVSLAGMKRVLGPDALEIDAQFIALQNVQSDVQVWRDGFARRDHSIWALHRGDLLEGLEVRDWAAGLGEEFEEWLFSRREQLETEWRALASMIAVTHLRASRYEQALPYLKLACENTAGPQEDASRRLMLALGSLGRGDEAIQTFSVLTRMQRDELGVEPTARTRAALAAARNSPLESQELLAQEWPQAEVTTSIEVMPLVGRQQELTMLSKLLNIDTGSNTPAIVLLGEPGFGKTRLAQALTEHWCSSTKGAFLFSGNATRSALPLSVFETAIRQLAQQRQTVLEQMPSIWRDALARLIPDMLTSAGQPSTPELERLGVLEAVRALLNQTQPVLILLDDLQWADALTLELVQHLMTKPPQAGLVFVGTLRDNENGTEHLNQFLTFFARANGRTHHVKPLDQPAITALATALQQPTIDAAQLRAVSGGNPLHVLELLRADPDTQAQQMQDLIEARLDMQPDVSRQTLEALVVLGDGSSLGLLQRVAGRSVEEIAKALEQLARAGLVNASEHGVQFEHDLPRQAVLNRINHVRLGLLHLRSARMHKQNPAVAAPHYWMARTLWEQDDETPALKAFLEAGQTYVLRGDLPEGLNWFDRALEHTHDTAERIQVLTKRSRMLERHSRYDEALQDLEVCEVLAVEIDASILASILNARSALLINYFGDVVNAKIYAERTLALLGDTFGENVQVEKAKAMAMLGWCHILQRDFAQAEKIYKQAIQLQRVLKREYDLSSSLDGLSSALIYTDRVKAIHVLEEATLLAEKTKNYSVLGSVLDKLGILHRREKKLKTAMEYAKRAIETRSIYGFEYIFGIWLNNLGNIYFDYGDFLSAHSNYVLSLKSRDVQNNIFHKITIYSNIAEVNLRLLNSKEVRKALVDAYLLLEKQPMPALEADLNWFEGEINVLESRKNEAEEKYISSAKLAQKGKSLDREVFSYSRLARLTNRQDYANQASDLKETADSRAAQAFVQGNYIDARVEIKQVGDLYEILRLEFDIGVVTNDSQKQKQIRSLFPIQHVLE